MRILQFIGIVIICICAYHIRCGSGVYFKECLATTMITAIIVELLNQVHTQINQQNGESF